MYMYFGADSSHLYPEQTIASSPFMSSGSQPVACVASTAIMVPVALARALIGA
jgi:hypothetical protein